MQVDEKGLAAGIEAAKESMADRDNHWEVALAVITAYLSARSAEPVAPEIGEEEIARVVLSHMDDLRTDIYDDIYNKGTVATNAASAILALLQPALERARREERERCAQIAADKTTGYCECEGFGCDCGNYDDAGSAGAAASARHIAAAIRKGSGE